MMDEPQQLLTINQACVFLNIRRSMFYEMIREGQFTIIKVNKRSLLSRVKLQEWINKTIAEAHQ